MGRVLRPASIVLVLLIVLVFSTEATSDPLAESLVALGFGSREELIEFFSMEDVKPSQLSACEYGEVECIYIAVDPYFTMTNPTRKTFDGWLYSDQPHVPDWDGKRVGTPPGGPWLAEGVTLRPWLRYLWLPVVFG